MSSIRELARHLNISIGTVSRALNGRSDVSAETRRRVLEAAERAQLCAQPIRPQPASGTTNMIAFLLETVKGMPLADTIFMTVLDGLRTALADRSLDLMVLMSGPDEEGSLRLSSPRR